MRYAETHMDNHFHLVLDCPDGGLSAFMQHVGAKFTRHANERSGGDGPIFRSRFFSRVIIDERYLVNAVRYVHRNPKDLGPGVELDTYRWSSHRTYLGLRATPRWLSNSPVLDWFDDTAQFHRFVTLDADPTARIDCGAATLITACEAALDAHSPDDRAAQGRLRTVLYLLLDRVDVRTRTELTTFLAPSSPSAFDQALRRARRAIDADPTTNTILRAVVDLTGTFTLCQTQRERRPTG
jgi:hypothetical protein